jgi:hypothetical protein
LVKLSGKFWVAYRANRRTGFPRETIADLAFFTGRAALAVLQ